MGRIHGGGHNHSSFTEDDLQTAVKVLVNQLLNEESVNTSMSAISKDGKDSKKEGNKAGGVKKGTPPEGMTADEHRKQQRVKGKINFRCAHCEMRGHAADVCWHLRPDTCSNLN